MHGFHVVLSSLFLFAVHLTKESCTDLAQVKQSTCVKESGFSYEGVQIQTSTMHWLMCERKWMLPRRCAIPNIDNVFVSLCEEKRAQTIVSPCMHRTCIKPCRIVCIKLTHRHPATLCVCFPVCECPLCNGCIPGHAPFRVKPTHTPTALLCIYLLGVMT